MVFSPAPAPALAAARSRGTSSTPPTCTNNPVSIHCTLAASTLRNAHRRCTRSFSTVISTSATLMVCTVTLAIGAPEAPWSCLPEQVYMSFRVNPPSKEAPSRQLGLRFTEAWGMTRIGERPAPLLEAPVQCPILHQSTSPHLPPECSRRLFPFPFPFPFLFLLHTISLMIRASAHASILCS